MEQRLKGIYYDPRNPASLSTPPVLAAAANVGLREAQKFLRSQPTYTLHKNARKRYPTRRYYVNNIDDQWQCDLMDLQALARYNNGNRFVLTVIDILSRYGWARPLKSKHGTEVKKAFQSIFREGRIPKRIQSDQGTEFENRSVRSLFRQHDIELFSVKSAYKAALVERWNRTLKTRLWKYFTAKNTYKWLNVLQDIVYAYNHRKHRIIGCAPASVNETNAMMIWSKLYGNRRRGEAGDIKVGDIVRISKVKSVFEKGYLPNWTEEEFKVIGINRKFYPTTYTLADSDGNVIDGSFYRQEIQPILRQDNVYVVEEIVRRQRRNGAMWYLVKWLGYPSSANSWVHRRDLSLLHQRF
jgi:hypothetical protein